MTHERMTNARKAYSIVLTNNETLRLGGVEAPRLYSYGGPVGSNPARGAGAFKSFTKGIES